MKKPLPRKPRLQWVNLRVTRTMIFRDETEIITRLSSSDIAAMRKYPSGFAMEFMRDYKDEPPDWTPIEGSPLKTFDIVAFNGHGQIDTMGSALRRQAEESRRARAFPAMLAALEIILPRLPEPLDDCDHSASAVAYRAVAAAIEAAKKPSTSPKEEPCPNPSYPS